MTTSRRPLRFRRRLAAMALCLLVGTAGGANAEVPPAQQLEDQRIKQLAVFEQLLGETVQEYVKQRLAASIDAAQQPGDEAGTPDTQPPLVVRVATAAPPHGIYIDGYGVIFSIQTPQVAVIPQMMETRLRGPRELLVVSPLAEGGERRVTIGTGAIPFRAGMITRSLRELRALMERAEHQGAEVEVTAAHMEKLEQLQQVLEELGAATANASEDEEAAAVGRSDAGTASPERTGRRRRDTNFEYYQQVLAQNRSLRQDLERTAAVTTAAINDAAIDTLAQYGAVIKGLDNDEHISVLVFPPSRLPFGNRAAAGPSEEYVISVRYGDIRDFDNQKIDAAKFRSRVRIHSRLGAEIALRERAK